MNDRVKVDGPVSVQSDSRASIAFELMKHIASHEASAERENRDYWLTLYTQCFKAANGTSLKYVLDKGSN